MTMTMTIYPGPWVTDSKQLLLATERRLLVWNNDDFVNSEGK